MTTKNKAKGRVRTNWNPYRTSRTYKPSDAMAPIHLKNNQLFLLAQAEKKEKAKEFVNLCRDSLILTEKAKEKAARIAKWKEAWKKSGEKLQTKAA